MQEAKEIEFRTYMSKKTVAVDYTKCNPEKCNQGVCVAVGACEHRSLRQDSPYETPEINPFKWCHGCAEFVQACPLKAIKRL